MKIETYNYILNTLLRVAPFFAGSVLDQSIKKSGHTIDSISAGEMLKILKSEVLPKLSKNKDFLTDSIVLANTTTIQTNTNNEIIYSSGPLESLIGDDFTFEKLSKLGFVLPIQECPVTTVREIIIDKDIFKVSISPIFNTKRAIIGTLSTLANLSLQREIEIEILNYSDNLRKEIDARIDAEDELKENQTLLFQSSKLVALGEMASGIAHEINNPLASLKLSIDLLKKLKEKGKISNEKLEEQFKAQLDLVDRMNNTIQSMKKLSRPTGITDFNYISVKQVIHDVLTVCGEKFALNDVQIKFDTSKEDILIYAQETQLGQVLINLLNNSFDEICDQFQDPWIEIDWSKSETFFFITITDCGLGIPMERAEKIFNPFYSGKVDRGGTGLGLSISSQIMKSHKGDLYIDFEYPNTRFVLSLPISQEKK